MKNKMQFLKFNKSNLQFSAVGKKKKERNHAVSRTN